MVDLARLCSFLVGAGCVSAAIYTNPSQLRTSSYDYVIVGGGTAGLVLANRLTENANVTVLVLEAGGTPAGNIGIEVPLLAPSLAPGTAVDWGYKTVPQRHLNNRQVAYMRGKVLGGSSSINYMIYNRGTRDDHNYFATQVECEDLKWDSMLKYFDKVEKAVPPTDNHNTSEQWDVSIHSKSGMVEISLPGFTMAPDPHVFATTAELPDDFPFARDFNSGRSIGIGWNQATIGHNGARQSSFVSYLQPSHFQDRANLAVLVSTQAIKLVPESCSGSKCAFSNGLVHYVFDGTQKGSIAAKKEIIVSAGVFETPHLLQLSGIGDAVALSKFNISTLVNLLSVGQNLSDHALLRHTYMANTNATVNAFLAPDVIQQNIQTWNLTGKGPLADPTANTLGFLRLPNNSTIFKTVKDPAPGPDAGHWELIIVNGDTNPGTPPVSPPLPNGSYMTFDTQVMTSTSRGTVTLMSSNPLDPPLIDPQWMTTDWDKAVMRHAVRASLKFAQANAWNDYLRAPVGDFAKVTQDTSDDNIDAFIIAHVGTIWHGVGTAAMSPKGAKWGVVDPDHKVKHTEGLRVVDASVFPRVPTMHPQGVVYAYAERAADIIKAGL
ncbi:aryl-alcohol-oxidase from pleurotus Eryingii [Trametopsis cervina]|nr:aryl-alcohol-oxidase from pleurotus Eryingii [Trametopsis cervina]